MKIFDENEYHKFVERTTLDEYDHMFDLHFKILKYITSKYY